MTSNNSVRICNPDNVSGLKGNILRIEAPGINPFVNELCEISWGDDSLSFGRVIAFKRSEVVIQVYNGTLGVARNATVKFLGHAQKLTFSTESFGRVFSGGGVPLDGLPVLKGTSVDIGTPSVNPIKREMPSQFIETGIPMIDIFNSLVGSQKIPIFAAQGEPYNDLLLRISSMTSADVVVLGCMGMPPAEYDRITAEMQTSGASTKTIVFAHTTADPASECLMVPDMVLATAENFALKGKNVLVMLTDMTSYADALKARESDLEKIPAERGYPGNLYSQLARLYEKACDFVGEGVITIIGVSTMPDGDVTHPVPDNTGYITEGQFFLKDARIDPFRSLSRLKQQVNDDTRDDHRSLMNAMVQLYAEAQGAREKAAMGHDLTNRDNSLLEFASDFEVGLMDLSVSLSLNDALDTCWTILKHHFSREDVPIDRR
ncbi:V-type ATP synthase subunit B, partial [Candidatus Peregrinibacteria bacterium]|nr:V-type ATP synthase subunit B [Candidatus Peregrinibacteria bacterium]